MKPVKLPLNIHDGSCPKPPGTIACVGSLTPESSFALQSYLYRRDLYEIHTSRSCTHLVLEIDYAKRKQQLSQMGHQQALKSANTVPGYIREMIHSCQCY
jgi:hypothetical protein